jgi:hypothetical protein
MNHNAPLDFSVVPYEAIPGPEYRVLVAQVDADGNDIAGIRLPYLEAPLGTHTGWAVLKEGAGFPDTCGQNGTFVPFANTKPSAWLRAIRDFRSLSGIENHNDYVRAVDRAAKKLVKEGFSSKRTRIGS